jgi:Tfp pilus assembly protein PilX
MKGKDDLIHSQRGSAMLAALIIFLVLSVLGAATLSVVAMEARIAANDTRAEQARQAADAGIQLGRDILLNYMSSSQTVPTRFSVNINSANIAEVTIDTDRLDSQRMATITSRGTSVNAAGKTLASKTARAEVNMNIFPNVPVQTDTLSVVGKYSATVASDLPGLPGELSDSFDWQPVAYEYDDITRYAVRGKTYNDFSNDFSPEYPHPFFQPGNIHNPTPNVWWAEYVHETKQSGPLAWDQINLHKSLLNIYPFWKPSGVLMIKDAEGDPAAAAFSQWGSEIIGSTDNVFDDYVISPGIGNNSNYPLDSLFDDKSRVVQVLPPKIIKSTDFIGQEVLMENYPPPSIRPEHFDAYRRLARTSTDWQYIAADSPLLKTRGQNCYELDVNDPLIEQPRWFIDLPAQAKVTLNFTAAIRSDYSHSGWEWLDKLINDILQEPGTFFSRFYTELDSITAVTPASLEVGYDSFIFEGKAPSGGKPHIFLIAGEDVNLYIEPAHDWLSGVARWLPNSGSERKVRTFILAGHNVNIISTPQKMTFTGIISAAREVNIRMDYFTPNHPSLADWLSLREIEKQVNIIKDPTIINDFPDPWHYLGIAPIVSYKYLN